MLNKRMDAFAGGNTSEGFFSLFNYIINKKNANKIIYLKGGPGTGKSTLMKSIADYFEKCDYSIEYFHCSSDSDSLDGIKIKELNIAMLDATAPHSDDPKYPGAIGDIINLGEFWNCDPIKEHTKEIIEISEDISNTFKRAYSYLKSAKFIHEDWMKCNSNSLNYSKLYKLEYDIKNSLINNISKDAKLNKSERHLFATAFTPEGIISFINNICSGLDNIYVLNGGPGTGKTIILKDIGQELNKLNIPVIFYHDPLLPKRIEHLVIPSLNAAILTSNEINKQTFLGQQIYMDNILDSNIVKKNKSKIDEDKDLFYEILNKALVILNSEKSIHDDLEKYYLNNMNFDKVDKLREDLITSFLDAAKSN